MTTPSDIPPVPVQPLPVHPAQQEAEKVRKVATGLVKARSYLSTTLKTTVPAAATGALVVLISNRRNRSENKDTAASETDVTVDYDNE